MLKNWLKAIEKRAKAADANGEPFGACLLPDPNGGTPICVQLDSTTCKNLKGKFLGGDCFAVALDTIDGLDSKKPATSKKKPRARSDKKRRG